MSFTALAAGETRSEELIEALREAILVGRYGPGARLRQEELAATFGTSRIPLREALRRLEGEGLVHILPNRGAVVTSLTPQDIADVYDLRFALESLALRRAAERGADLVAHTREQALRARQALGAGDLTTLFHMDRDYHAEIAEASGNVHLVAALDGQWSQIMRVMHAFLKRYPDHVWHEHLEIATHVANGDADAAIATLQRHLFTGRNVLITD